MQSLVTTFKDGSPATSLPAWSMMLWSPNNPESPTFVENFVKIAAERRGIFHDELVALADATFADIAPLASPRPARRQRPRPETLLFSAIFAEGVREVSTMYPYATDLFDTNSGQTWSKENIRPYEYFSGSLRTALCGDCEDKNKEVVEIFRGVLRMRFAEGDRIAAAAWAVARCYVPMMVFGEVESRAVSMRDKENTKQYLVKEDEGAKVRHNAHCYAFAISGRACAVMASRNTKHRDRAAVLASYMLDPWEEGLPTLLIDGTTGAAELYPRKWNAHSEYDPLMDVVEWPSRSWMRSTMDSKYYYTVRNCFVPYGLEDSAGRSVYEIYWYSETERGTCHGVFMPEIFRTRHAPHPDCPAPPPLPGKDERIWFAITPPPTAEELRSIFPLVAALPPIAPYPQPLQGFGIRATRLVANLRRALPTAKHLAEAAPKKRAVVAIRAANVTRSEMHRVSRSLSNRGQVYFSVHELIKGQPVLYLHIS